MSILDNVNLPQSADSRAVSAYIKAQDAKSFATHAEFLHPEVVFNGLVLTATGAARIAKEMDQFLPAIAHLSVDAAACVEEGERSRYLVLYQFQLQGQPKPQPLADHITVRNGLIERVDNVFDVTLLPPMG